MILGFTFQQPRKWLCPYLSLFRLPLNTKISSYLSKLNNTLWSANLLFFVDWKIKEHVSFLMHRFISSIISRASLRSKSNNNLVFNLFYTFYHWLVRPSNVFLHVNRWGTIPMMLLNKVFTSISQRDGKMSFKKEAPSGGIFLAYRLCCEDK